jgi:hypothetical protein
MVLTLTDLDPIRKVWSLATTPATREVLVTWVADRDLAACFAEYDRD